MVISEELMSVHQKHRTLTRKKQCKNCIYEVQKLHEHAKIACCVYYNLD